MTKFKCKDDQGYNDVLGELKRLILIAKKKRSGEGDTNVEQITPEAHIGSVEHKGDVHQGARSKCVSPTGGDGAK